MREPPSAVSSRIRKYLARHLMKISNQSFSKLVTCATLLLALGSCSGGGSDGGSTPAPVPAPPVGTVTITGTVSGTVIKVLRADTNPKTVLFQTDTASLTGPPFPFTFSNIPLNVPIQLFFFSAGQTYPLYLGNPPTSNVFTVQTAVLIDLGFVTMSGGRATCQCQPSNITSGDEDLSPLPPEIEPLPATLTVTTPSPATGSVEVDFGVQNFVIGGQDQPHIHIRVDGGETRHFFNGQTNNVLDDSKLPTTDVVHQSTTSFRVNGLAVGQHQVTVKLATASDNEFANQEANPPVVTVTINSPPAPPATLTISSPSQGASLLSGPVDVSVTVQNFSIGGQGASHLHIYLDGGTANHFFNGTTNQVLDGGGQPVANITWQSTTSFQLTALSGGSHTIRLRLADAADQEMPNAEAKPPDLNFTVQAPPGSATLTLLSPASGVTLPTGPVLVEFTINSPVITSATPRMHFYVDNDPVVYKYYDGAGINEDNGVRYQGIHTHFVHWKSGSSIQFNALSSGPHQIRFVLVDQSEVELTGTEITRAFNIAAGSGGAFSLQPVVGGLNFAVAMATAPDGRIFVNELQTGNIRVVTTNPWQLQTLPFATLPAFVPPGYSEMGLLGIAVRQISGGNLEVYVYYTASSSINRVVRFTATTDSNGNTVAAGGPTVILDNIPAATNHNGGIINFGPIDGMLYITVGENEVAADAQSLSSRRGKILRINPDGTIPSDNPFSGSPIYSLGHRNSFGFTFHPHTNDLWETENGENFDDEVNRIVRGGNYGWPDFHGIVNTPPFIDPIYAVTPTIAPTGIVAIREGSLVYPAQYWNNLLFADFNYGHLHLISLTGAFFDQFGDHTLACDCGQGALLAVMHGLNNVPGQDGYIYVTNGNSIYRVVVNNP